MNGNRAQKKAERKRILRNRKRRIAYRLREVAWSPQDRPMFAARNIRYELADKARGMSAGGIGAMHLLARRTGLIEAIDKNLHLLKVHLPYPESDPVLNMAYNILCGGTCLQDLELLRNNQSHLDALGAQRIPDPTTAGDFCRRFDEVDVELLQMAINDVRGRVWKQQPAAFFEEAILDADGSLGPEASGTEANGLEDGVQRVPECVHETSLSDRADGAADGISIVVMEPVAGGVLPRRGRLAGGPERIAPLTAHPGGRGQRIASATDVGIRKSRFSGALKPARNEVRMDDEPARLPQATERRSAESAPGPAARAHGQTSKPGTLVLGLASSVKLLTSPRS